MNDHDADAQLNRLARLIHDKNEADAAISAITGRPALIGHLGEFIASAVFEIRLHPSASHKGSDGAFTAGLLAGRSVNVKWYARNEGILDLNVRDKPDDYLVLTGTRLAATSPAGVRPWLITSAFLFDAANLETQLINLGVKVGVASSVRRVFWDEAEVYPHGNNSRLVLDQRQRNLLAGFEAPRVEHD